MSILNSIRKLSNNLLQQVQEQSGIINFFEDGSCQSFTSCIPSLNTTMTVTNNVPGEEAEIIVNKGGHSVLNRYHILDSDGNINPGFEDWFDNAMENQLGAEIQLSSFQNSAISTANVYTAITEMNNLFLTKVKVKSSDLTNLVANDNLIVKSDKANLIALITQASDESGDVSQYSWLSIVKTISTEPSNADQQSTLQPASGSPFTIQSFWNLMKQIVLSAINVILDALALVFRGIMAIVSLALSFITRVIQNISPTDITVNPDDESDYIYGAITNLSLYYDDNFEIVNTITNVNLYTSGNNAIFVDGCGVDHWIYEIDSDHIGINSRLKLNVDPVRLMNYVRSKVSYSFENGNTVCVANIHSPFDTLGSVAINELLLNDSESLMMNYDMNYAAKVMMASVLALGIFQLPNTGSLKLKHGSFGSKRVTSMYQIAEALLDVCSYTESYDSIPAQTSFPQLYKSIYDTISAYYSTADGLFTLGVKLEQSTAITTLLDDDWTSTITNTGYVINHDCMYSSAGLLVIGSGAVVRNPGAEICYVTDNIYTGWSFKPAEFTLTQVVTAIMTVLGIVTALFIGGSLVKKAISNRRRITQLNRANQLSALRDAYTTEPNNRNAKALNKAVNKYNRQARMFGWDTYDVTNAWFNAGDDFITTKVLSNGLSNSLDPTEQIMKVIKG